MEPDELRKIFKSKTRKESISKKGKIIIKPGFEKTTFEEFAKWFDRDVFKMGCKYCGTTNERSYELYSLRPNATRGGKRGKRLELDRKDPYKSYDELENLVWCCYWCNNAKSNFFSSSEFESIGSAIKEVLNGVK
jgi:hypothetical protein